MITTAEYLALSPQERWAIIEERVFGRKIAWDMAYGGNVRYITDEGLLCPVTNRDQPNGWWEIVEEMERRDFAVIISNPKVFTNGGRKRVRLVTLTTPKHQQFEAAFIEAGMTVQVAALRAVRFIED